jgi:hypothetical protein
VRHFHETMTGAMRKGPETIEDSKVEGLASILQHNKLKSTVPDYRFPNQNQLNNCWQTMNEYQVCAEQRGRDDVSCLQKARDYNTLCPAKWIAVRCAPLPPHLLLVFLARAPARWWPRTTLTGSPSPTSVAPALCSRPDFHLPHPSPRPPTHPTLPTCLPVGAGLEVPGREREQHHRG